MYKNRLKHKAINNNWTRPYNNKIKRVRVRIIAYLIRIYIRAIFIVIFRTRFMVT